MGAKEREVLQNWKGARIWVKRKDRADSKKVFNTVAVQIVCAVQEYPAGGGRDENAFRYTMQVRNQILKSFGQTYTDLRYQFIRTVVTYLSLYRGLAKTCESTLFIVKKQFRKQQFRKQ